MNYISNNIGLNKIIIKNNNINNSKNIINQNYGFQKVQNTSKINDIIQQNNNALNEIKSSNLENEIHKIINTSSSSSTNSLGGKRKNKKKKIDSKLNISEHNLKGDIIMGFNNNILIKKGNHEKISDGNTQKLELELKEQIKKYIFEENNI